MVSPFGGKSCEMTNGMYCFLSHAFRGLTIFRTCALHGRILSLKQDSTHLHYRATWPALVKSLPSPSKKHPLAGVPDEDRGTEDLLKHYLNLAPDLTALYEQWSSADANFKKRAPKFTGVRILKQDPWEALVGFICSSNNNIVRISQMVRYPSKPDVFLVNVHYRSIIFACTMVP